MCDSSNWEIEENYIGDEGAKMLISAANENAKMARIVVCINARRIVKIGNSYISEEMKKELTASKKPTLDLYG